MRAPPSFSLDYCDMVGKPVEVYWNIKSRLWSVRYRGRIQGHHKNVGLKGVRWIVQPGGQARVRREQKKYVHAFARGTLTLDLPTIYPVGDEVRYNPYRDDTFVDLFENPVHWSQHAYMTCEDERPKVYALGVVQ